MLWPWENSESHKQLSELIQTLVSNFESLWHGRPCRTLQDSDAIFWVEFFHSCQEAMLSMFTSLQCDDNKTKQYKKKTTISPKKSEGKLF